MVVREVGREGKRALEGGDNSSGSGFLVMLAGARSAELVIPVAGGDGGSLVLCLQQLGNWRRFPDVQHSWPGPCQAYLLRAGCVKSTASPIPEERASEIIFNALRLDVNPLPPTLLFNLSTSSSSLLLLLLLLRYLPRLRHPRPPARPADPPPITRQETTGSPTNPLPLPARPARRHHSTS